MLEGLIPAGPRGTNRLIVFIYHLPVDPIPPPFEELGLTGDTVVHHPNVLPGVNAEDGMDIDGTGGQVLLVLRMWAHGTRIHVAQRSIRAVRGHIHRLPPGVGSGIRRAGVVCAEYVYQTFPFKVLGQPHKSRTKHGIRSGQEVHL